MTVGSIPPVAERIRAAVARRAGAERGDQARLATELGVSRNTVSMWLRGRITPEPGHWPAIERHLGMRPGTLAMAAADYFDPGYRQVRRRLARLERDTAGLAEDVALLRGE